MHKGFQLSGWGLHRVAAATLLAIALGGGAAAQNLYDRNLLVNPGAEDGEASAERGAEAVASIPGWTRTGKLTVGSYNTSGFHDLSSLNGIILPGDKYFIGGPGAGTSRATQTVDLSSAAADIDAGKVKFVLSGVLGTASTRAATSLKATFKDAKGAVLLESTIKAGDYEQEQNGWQSFLRRTATGWILPNARTVELVLDLSDTSAIEYNDNAADNLELILSTTPVYGSELVINATAEGHEYDANVPGWNATYNFGTTAYSNGDSCANPVEPCIPRNAAGPADRGLRFFHGSYSREDSWAFQTVDVTLVRDAIDSGAVTFNASAWLGGYNEERDEVVLQVNFLDASGKKIGGLSTDSVTSAERNNVSALIERKLTGAIAAGTRKLDIRMAFRMWSPIGLSANHGYADNISVTLVMPQQSLDIQPSRIYNAASNATGAIAPGEMIDIAANGVNISGESRMQINPQGRVSTELAGVRVFFDGTQMPLLYVNSSRIGGIVPYDVANKATASVRVEYQGSKSNTIQLQIAKSAPGIFTQEAGGKGRGLIYDDKWTLNSAANAAAKGSVVTVMFTGGGRLTPDAVEGRIENGTLPRLAESATLTIGGQPAEILYAGTVPYTWNGLLMIQARVPASAPTGSDVPVVVTVAGASSQSGVTMAVK